MVTRDGGSGRGDRVSTRRLARHFRSPQHRHEAATVGMWLFIATEVMLFGGLFCVYAVFRVGRPDLFAYGTRFLDTGWGAINTGVMLLGSVMMACAVRSARGGQQWHTVLFLALTLVCTMDFLGVKYIEYRDKIHENLVGGPGFSDPGSDATGPLRAAVLPGVVSEGEMLFRATCAACHGGGGEGLANFGRPLTTSSFVAGLDDEGLLAFLRTGRAVDDPLNTSGVAMAPRGGNPLLTDQELAHVVAFMRTLQTEELAGAAEGPRAGQATIAPSAEPTDQHAEPFVDPRQPPNAHLFFSIYFLLTGMHAVHVLAGGAVIAWLMVQAQRGRFGDRLFTSVKLGGLYWHFVGIVWLLIFPLLYLVG